jgi:hypothetical protein
VKQRRAAHRCAAGPRRRARARRCAHPRHKSHCRRSGARRAPATTMLEARLVQGNLLKKTVDAVKELVTEANLDCGAAGISMQVGRGGLKHGRGTEEGG